MPNSVDELFKSAGLLARGPISFGEPVPEGNSGVYVVSRMSDPSLASITPPSPPAICLQALQDWINTAPKLQLDGKPPSPEQLGDRLTSFWLPEEPVIYIGQTHDSIRQRVRALCRHTLGYPKPHRGGHWLKTLTDLDAMFVFWAPVDSSKTAELRMLRYFVANVPESSSLQLYDHRHPFPWANLYVSGLGRKLHNIVYSVL